MPYRYKDRGRTSECASCFRAEHTRVEMSQQLWAWREGNMFDVAVAFAPHIHSFRKDKELQRRRA
eukprot:8042700-Pyramimonas_sp.AAC.1